MKKVEGWSLLIYLQKKRKKNLFKQATKKAFLITSYFEMMRMDYDLVPKVEHWACIISLLGQAGRLADAEDYIVNSGFRNDPILWHVLLRSCLFCEDKEKGIEVGERLIELEPHVATSYVLLYNMYMDAGNFSSAMRTRGLMREKGLSKDIRVSWIEIGAFVHYFPPNGNAHLHLDAAFQKLQEMLSLVKPTLRTDGMKILELDYQSEKWRKSIINDHGELLAVALGFSSLPKSVPVRIVNNQRVCKDCHILLKLFSEAQKRVVILRDSVRFHHFSQGSCSCNDYW